MLIPSILLLTSPRPGPVQILVPHDTSIPLLKRQEMVLTLGAKSISAPVKIEPALTDFRQMIIPKTLGTALGLHQVKKINLRLEGANLLRLGPYIGLLISRDKLERQSLGKHDPVYLRLARYSREIGGNLVMFSYQGIDWENRLISGLTLTGDGAKVSWQAGTFALPRIIYDRSFGLEGRLEGARLREKLSVLPNLKVFNIFPKLGKLETYQTLSLYEKTRDFIPPYQEYSLLALEEMVSRYGRVFLKPDQLAKGEGIIKITPLPEGYAIQRHSSSEYLMETIPCLSHITQYMISHDKLFNDNFVIQKEIKLATCLGNSFDIRVMLQKNGGGCWEVTGSLGRIAQQGVIVTGPRSGGKVLPLDTILAWSFPQRSLFQKQIVRSIHEFCLEAGKILETNFGLLGELGIDLGLDQSGRLWLIEINGKPLKISMELLHDPVVDMKIYRYPVSFAAYLDGFSII
ncbi:MAG: YheC/YheD family endospore coat-associated protein [Thermincolia bacterium]